MDSVEFSEWIAYCGLEPFGDEWRPAATVAALLANHYSGGKGKHYTSDDFMPLSHQPQVEPDAKEIAARLRSMIDGDNGNNHKPGG